MARGQRIERSGTPPLVGQITLNQLAVGAGQSVRARVHDNQLRYVAVRFLGTCGRSNAELRKRGTVCCYISRIQRLLKSAVHPGRKQLRAGRLIHSANEQERGLPCHHIRGRRPGAAIVGKLHRPSRGGGAGTVVKISAQVATTDISVAPFYPVVPAAVAGNLKYSNHRKVVGDVAHAGGKVGHRVACKLHHRQGIHHAGRVGGFQAGIGIAREMVAIAALVLPELHRPSVGGRDRGGRILPEGAPVGGVIPVFQFASGEVGRRPLGLGCRDAQQQKQWQNARIPAADAEPERCSYLV